MTVRQARLSSHSRAASIRRVGGLTQRRRPPRKTNQTPQPAGPEVLNLAAIFDPRLIPPYQRRLPRRRLSKTPPGSAARRFANDRRHFMSVDTPAAGTVIGAAMIPLWLIGGTMVLAHFRRKYLRISPRIRTVFLVLQKRLNVIPKRFYINQRELNISSDTSQQFLQGTGNSHSS